MFYFQWDGTLGRWSYCVFLLFFQWDGTLGRWSYCGAMDDPDNRSPCSGSDDEQSRLRRSPRLRGQRDGSGPSRIDIRL